MSLRIKLPAKVAPVDLPMQASGSEPASHRRKSVKRRRTVESDGEDNPVTKHAAESPGSPQQPYFARSRTTESLDDGAVPGSDGEAQPQQPKEDAKLLHKPKSRASLSSNARPRNGKVKPRTNVDGPPTKKKRVVISDPESEDTVTEELDQLDVPHDNRDFAYEKRSSKRKGKAKTTGTDTKGSLKVEIQEARAEEHRIPSTGNDTSGTSASAGLKRSRSQPPNKAEEGMVDVVGEVPLVPDHTVASPPQPKGESPTIPAKKRKLPTIRKNKPMGSAGPSTPSSSIVPAKPATSVTVPKLSAPSIPEVAKLPAVVMRKIPATVWNADFDLRNKSVYAELFKSAGGSTPRSGLNRREKDEERRKELNKMRDEAKANRILETTRTFDLQAQMDKISRFEERLKHERSSALYPNFLAGKWREIWEREKRQQKERGWLESGSWNEASAGEEDEMNHDR